MRLKSIVLLLLTNFIFLGIACCGTNIEAQELRKALRDYRDERIFNYQPTDPQYRGKMFNVHTGHYGKFYNCDREEDKRNSPYICWKPHHEKDFPTRLGFCENLRRDIAEITQRLNDGAGACRQADCNCNQCQQAVEVIAQPSCSCATCAAKAQSQSLGRPIQTLAKSTASRVASIQSAGTTKFAAKKTAAKSTNTTCQCPECVTPSGQVLQNGSAVLSAKQAIRNASLDATRSFQTRHGSSGRGYGLLSGKILNTNNAAVQSSEVQVAELAPIMETSSSNSGAIQRR